MLPEIQKGDWVVHSDYGRGTVMSDVPESPEHNTVVRIDFGSYNLEFLYGYIVNKCKIIRSEENKQADINEEERRMQLEEDLKNAIENFRRFSLSERSLSEIENFLRFKIHYKDGHKKSLRYNLLIQSENNGESLKLVKELENAMNKFKLLPFDMVIATEDEMGRDIPGFFPTSCSALVINDCRPSVKDTAAELTSTVRDTRVKERIKKDKLWQLIMSLAADDPDCTVIAAGPRGFVDYLSENDELFYRFFAHHITLRPSTVDEITSAFYRGLEDEGISIADSFREGMEGYLKEVYPKADLRDSAFVDDLLNRVLVSYHLKPIGTLTEEHVPFYRLPRTFEEISAELNKLVGLKRVKDEFRRLNTLNQDAHNANRQRLHFAFVGNPGTGKTTVAKLTADLLYSMKLIKRNKIVTVGSADVDGVYIGQASQLMREKIDEARGGVLFIDEAYFLISNTTDTKSNAKHCLDVLIPEMENHSDELTVIFAGYPDEIDALLESNSGLRSRVPHIFVFEDYSVDELVQIFVEFAAKEEMTLADDAREVLAKRIETEMSGEHFGNARGVENIYHELKAVHLEKNARKRSSSRVITADDVAQSLSKVQNKDIDDMIGLYDVKNRLKELRRKVNYIKYLNGKRNVSVPVSNLHMMFTGDPGTGKTKVARKIADIFYDAGLLKTNKMIEAERSTLVAGKAGETAIKTEAVIKKALNGVLFIDEAYSLYRPDSADDYGMEAIGTLITAMEKYKDKLVVIFAGYKSHMRTFLEANPGIASRIGDTIDFPNYTLPELVDIFCKDLIADHGFDVKDDAIAAAADRFKFFMAQPGFGNGRFVDNFVDAVITKRAQRKFNSRHYKDITAEDIPELRELLNTTISGQYLITDTEQSEKMRRRTAVHEAGHAIVSRTLVPEIRIKWLDINADAAGRLGKTVTEHRPENNTEKDMKASLAIDFGGRNAERLILGDHSEGCVHDMYDAKKLASYMINGLAMGEFGVTTEKDLLMEADRTATKILEDNREKLELLADTLLEKGAINEKELADLLK